MVSSSLALPTSKSPSSSSRTAARARMRARAAANAQSKKPDGEEPPPLKTEQGARASHPASCTQRPRPYSLQFPLREPSSTSHLSAGPMRACSSDSSPTIPRTRTPPRTSPTRNTLLTTTTADQHSSFQDTDRPLSFKRDPSRESLAQMEWQSPFKNVGAAPLIYARPKVKLYENEGDEDAAAHEGREDIDIAEAISDENTPEDGSDAPYIPGRTADNNLRCLTWLRSVRKGGDKPKLEW